MVRIKGSISIVDLTDSRSLVAYISSTNRRQVIYDPNEDVYLPNYSEDPNTLYPELYIAGGGSNIISQAKSVQWTVQIDSTGRFEPITDDYTIGEGNSLVIAKNVLEEHLSMLYRVEIIYHDRELDKDIIIQADMELVKLTNGTKGDKGEEGYTPVKGTDYFDGESGQDGVSSYLWVRYSQSSNGDPMVTDPTDALYIGTATTHVSIAPQFPSEFTWTKVKGDQGIRGETGDDGRTSYLHVKYSNDGGVTFTADNGESVGDWIGTYVDFIKDDSPNVGDYTWNKVKGDKGEQGPRGLEGLQGPEGKQGIQGPEGDDGQSSYTHIAYSTSETGDNFSHSTFDNATYIGMYVSIESDSSDIPSDYEWTLIKGKDGSQGLRGPEGLGGITPYFHTAYANSADGTDDFSVDDSSDKEYIGQYTSYARTGTGRNLAEYDNWIIARGETVGDYSFILTSDINSVGTNIRQTAQSLKLEPSNNYTFSFKIRKLTGNLNKIGGHITPNFVTASPTYVDGIKISEAYSSAGLYAPLDDGEWHQVVAHLKTVASITETGQLYIQPNRATYEAVSVEITDVMFEKGDKPTDWSPAPEDASQDSTNPEDYTWTKIKGDKGDKGEEGEDGADAVLLVIETPDGTTIRNSSGTLTAVSELFVGVLEVSNGLTHKWYKRLPGAAGDADSGTGWQRLTSSNNFGTSGYNSSILTIPPDAITGSATYMVIATYDGNTYRRQVTVNDITDPYTISILGDSFFRNGQGENTYTAKLYRNGEEVDENETLGYTYTWHQYSSTGDKVAGFEKTGKIITVSADEYQGKADLRVTVTR